MPDTHLILLKCPAKLNLALAVGPPQTDGFHPLASLMVRTDFCDSLQLSRSENTTSWSRRWANDAPVPSDLLHTWAWPNDLMYRAHRLLESHTGCALPVHGELTKRIPIGGGLAGGSANAAAVLTGLRSLFNLNISDNDLIRLAAHLGSDTAFLTSAMIGSPAAVCTGHGERLSPRMIPLQTAILLFPPGASLTGEVYRIFDELATFSDPEASVVRCDSVASDNAPPFNDLEQAACIANTAMAHHLKQLRQAGFDAHVTGSGSTLFVRCQPPHAEAMAQTLSTHSGLPAVVTRLG